MKGYGFRPEYVWYVPKPVNDVDKILDAFEILANHFEGCLWVDSQAKFCEMLESNGIKAGSSGAMGGRNWFTTFKYFGLAYVGSKDKRVHLTDVGEDIQKYDRIEIITDQLLKLQLPNPYQGKYIKTVELFPFRVILEILMNLPDYVIYSDEFSLFVIGLKRFGKDTLKEVVRNIKKYRKSSEHAKNDIKTSILREYTNSVRNEFKISGKNNRLVTPERVWTIISDYSKRHFLTLDFMDFCSYNHSKSSVYLKGGKILHIRKLIRDTAFDLPKEFDNEGEWFLFYGSPTYIRNKTKIKSLSKKGYRLKKLLETAEMMKKKTGSIKIKQLSETFEFPIKEILKKLKECGYINEVKELSEHNKIILKIGKLAKQYGLKFHVGITEQGVYRKFKDLSVPMIRNHFNIPDSVFRELRNIDVVWVKSNKNNKNFRS